MKRFGSGLLALFLLIGIASLCVPAVQAAEPAATEPEIDRAAVAAAYADYVGSAVPFTNFGYFGRYGSTDVLAFPYPSDSTGLQNPAFDDIAVARFHFLFPMGTLSGFVAYTDGTFLPVEEAYAQGLLTRDDIYEIWCRHTGTRPWKTGVPFADVCGDNWFFAEAGYCYDNGIFTGVSADRFAPDKTMTRAMLVTVLYRASGEPEASSSDFVDVPDKAWYARAVAWAAREGIVLGVDSRRFAPEQPVTREQAAAILYRWFCSGGPGSAKPLAELQDAAWTFERQVLDRDQISAWAQEPMLWAFGNHVLQGLPVPGNTDGRVAMNPRHGLTRAQCAAILARYLGG